MTDPKIAPSRTILGALLLVCSAAGCGPSETNRVQGYVEAEFVYVSAPLAGKLEDLHVRRGAHVYTGDPLFALDSAPEKAARDEAQERLAQARANWEDLKKGKRPSEIDALEANLKLAKAALALSEKELARHEGLARVSATAQQELDRSRSQRDQDRQRVLQLEADLLTAKLGARSDQIVAAAADMKARDRARLRTVGELAPSGENSSAAAQ